jgi:hypothetical protein
MIVIQICRENSSLVKIGQKYRALDSLFRFNGSNSYAKAPQVFSSVEIFCLFISRFFNLPPSRLIKSESVIINTSREIAANSLYIYLNTTASPKT